MSASTSPVGGTLAKIEHFVVLMLENRSFDHLFGALNAVVPGVLGITGNEFNYDDPNVPSPQQKRTVYPARDFGMPYDPPHEFPDVQSQLYGPVQGKADQPNPASDPAAMNGFLARTLAKVPNIYADDAQRVLSYFKPEQIPVLSTLAQQFAVFNNWHSSLPGPTWPNRFFVHAATSGGLNYSPSDEQIVAGFTFKGGTIYDRLGDTTNAWHIYHDGLPQSIGVADLRWNFLKQQFNQFNSNFRPMEEFETDLAVGDLAPYTFIEPKYDTGNNYLSGNSMHPLNDIRNGEALVKRVYTAIRKSSFWNSTMLVITFDEHGGFFDHVPPPTGVPTGDDHRYANPQMLFEFDRLGVRVPALVISAYTTAGTVVGAAGDPPFEHSSVAATLEKRFQLSPLTERDAKAPTLDIALNLQAPRDDAPFDLPDPAFNGAAPSALAALDLTTAAHDHAPLSDNQRTFLALALACDLEVTDTSGHQAVRDQYAGITTQKQAGDYITGVMSKITSGRQSA